MSNNWRTFVAATFLVASCFSSSVLIAADELECSGDGTQAELNACALQEYEQADAALNATWKELLKALDGQDTALAETRAAQRAWVKFRDAEVKAHFPLAEGEDARVMYGSMYPMSYNGVMTNLTQQRTEQLRARIDELAAY